MLSAVLAIAIGLGLWNLVSYYKRRGLESRFADGTRFEINDSLYGYVTDKDFVLIHAAANDELLRFGRDSLQRIDLGSDEDKKQRKSPEIVVLEWTQGNGAPKEFKLDIYDPESKEKARRLLDFIRQHSNAN
jgi:hypothetical protein